MANETPVIQFEDVSFGYTSQPVLMNVTLEVNPLDLVGFVGPNGGGKTTLLRLILGLETPDQGRVRVLGTTPFKARRKLGYVAQAIHFDPQFPVTVLDVVLMGRAERHLVGPYSQEDHTAAIHALEHVGLEHLKNRSFAELSGGERQRILIARALATEPEILLMDEPTANVDYRVEEMLYELLETLNRQLTIVLVSHNLRVVTEHANRIACVNHTVATYPTNELTQEIIKETYGNTFEVLCHDPNCQVTHASNTAE